MVLGTDGLTGHPSRATAEDGLCLFREMGDALATLVTAAQAKAEKKLLLLDFTGSDWCPYCIQMKKESLDTDFARAEEEIRIFHQHPYIPLQTLAEPRICWLRHGNCSC